MSKRLIFIGFWQDVLKEIIEFLEVKEYKDVALINHMKEVLEEKQK